MEEINDNLGEIIKFLLTVVLTILVAIIIYTSPVIIVLLVIKYLFF